MTNRDDNASSSKKRSAMDDLTSGDSNSYTGAPTPHPGQDHTLWPTGTPEVPPVPPPTPVGPLPSTPPPASPPPIGGDVPTSGTKAASGDAISTGSFLWQKSASATRDSPTPASTLRQNAIQTRIAVGKCEYNVQNLHWQWCNVTLDFENGRKLPYAAAAAYATQLYVKAWHAAVDSAIASGHVGPNKCNEFVLAVGEAMRIYFPATHYYLANGIYDFFAGFSQSHQSGWERVTEEDVKKSQNGRGDLDGMLVVGAARSVAGSGNEHGHVVLATPSGFPSAHPEGSGPWAIDAQRAEKRRCYRASRLLHTAIPNQLTKPLWAVYRP